MTLTARLFAMAALLLCATSAFAAQPVPRASSIAPSTDFMDHGKISDLKFSEIFDPAAKDLQPTKKLLSLNNKHVRMTGFMVQMENPLPDVFFLSPHPVFCDEEGGGTADIPMDAVRVRVRSAHGRTVKFVPRQLVVTGTLQVGFKADPDGQTSSLRLVLDGPADLPHATQLSKAPAKISRSLVSRHSRT